MEEKIVNFLIGKTNKEIFKILRKEFKNNKINFKPEQFPVLYFIWNGEDKLSKIAFLLNRPKSEITIIKKILIKSNLITEENDDLDKRLKKIKLTKQGEELKNITIKCLEKVFNLCCKGDDKMKNKIIDLDQKVFNNIKKK